MLIEITKKLVKKLRKGNLFSSYQLILNRPIQN